MGESTRYIRSWRLRFVLLLATEAAADAATTVAATFQPHLCPFCFLTVVYAGKAIRHSEIRTVAFATCQGVN